MDLEAVRALSDKLKSNIARAVVGQDETLELMMICLLAEGHILLEGVPGTAKTLLARSFAASLALSFGRIQFTPDLMPGDLIGTNLFNFQTNAFALTKGPIFTEILLADEINRTPPKTQAALLEAMNERAVTIDGVTHALGDGFLVIATQNPIEQQGTYPLPEAQLDRFLFKQILGYPDRDEERDIVRKHGHRTTMPRLEEFGLEPVADLETLIAVRALVAAITLSEDIVDYLVDIVRATRSHSALQYGASTRAANMLASAARASAALEGRDYVIPDDVKRLAVPALRHRVILAPGAEIDELSHEQVIGEILDQVAAPK